MRIIFFGTSHGVPEPNRRSSSILVEIGERRYLIDMGTQSIEQLRTRRMPVESVKGIFFTHMHGDHVNGLPSYLFLCAREFIEADPVICLPAPLDKTVAALRGWLECQGRPLRDFQFQEVAEGIVYEDEVVRVTAYRTQHTDHSYAYLLEAEGKRVLFSGDMSKRPQEDFPYSVLEQPLDLAVCECAHFDASVYQSIFEDRSKLKRLCITHYSDKRLASILKLLDDMADIPAIRALDGTEIVL